MEPRAKRSVPASAHDAERAVSRWNGLMTRLLFLMETTRVMLLRLMKAEKTQKSVKSERVKYVEETQATSTHCTHPERSRLNRGNQYASWTVCGACGARTSYEKKRSKAKAKAKSQNAVADIRPSPTSLESNLTDAPTTPKSFQQVEETQQQLRPGYSRAPSGASSSQGPAPYQMDRLENILATFMAGMGTHNQGVQTMIASMETAIREVAINQGHMLQFMRDQATASTPTSAPAPTSEGPMMQVGPNVWDIQHMAHLQAMQQDLGPSVQSLDDWERMNPNAENM